MKRQLLAVGCVGLAALMLTATTNGRAVAAPVAPAPVVSPSKIGSLVLPADEVGEIVGTIFEINKSARRPFPSTELGDNSACAPLFGPDSETYGTSYTAFRVNLLRDTPEDDFEYLILQRVGTYSDEQTATQTFQNAFSQSVARRCSGVKVQPKDSDTEWQLQVKSMSGDSAQWSRTQLYEGDPFGWVCSNQAGTQGNVLYSVDVCQFGNGSPTAAEIAERISNQAAATRS